MKLELIESNKNFTSDEQKSLFNSGVDIYDGYYFFVADLDEFEYRGVLSPKSAALRCVTASNNIQWNKVFFRGKNVAVGAASLKADVSIMGTE
jgi:hypothetical protein